MSTETIARRYSVALADVTLERNEADTIKAELAELAKLFAEGTELYTVFDNPAIAHASKAKLLDAFIAKTKPSKTTANFLKVMQHNGRLGDIVGINDRFATVLEERSGAVSVEITSARELPESERAEFERSLAKLTGKRVLINYSIDKDLIGGVVTRIGSTVYDASVKSKLENLKEQLVNG